MVHFHPEQFMLNDYAAGALAGAFALPVAVHLEFCPKCRAETTQLAQLGAELFGDLDPVPVGEDALARLMRRVDTPEPAVGDAAEKPAARAGNDLPRPLRGIVPDGVEALKWKRVSGSLRASTLQFGDAKREVALHHICSGGKVVQHGHEGNEITVVLRGSFSDQDGVYGPGDFLLKGPQDVHRPVAAQDGDCLCLSVLDAPIRLEGFFGAIAKPFLRLHPR